DERKRVPKIGPNVAFPGKDVGVNIEPPLKITLLTWAKLDTDVAGSRRAGHAVEPAVEAHGRPRKDIKSGLRSSRQHYTALLSIFEHVSVSLRVIIAGSIRGDVPVRSASSMANVASVTAAISARTIGASHFPLVASRNAEMSASCPLSCAAFSTLVFPRAVT